MSAIQINKITQQSLLDKIEKTSLREADKMYIFNHFRLGEKINDKKINALMLITTVLRNDNCEVTEFLDKKLRGALTENNIEIADLKTVQTKYRDINNYYVGEPFQWTNGVDW